MTINDVIDVKAISFHGPMKIGRCLAKKDPVFIAVTEFFGPIDDDRVDDEALERFTGSWNDPRPASTSLWKATTP